MVCPRCGQNLAGVSSRCPRCAESFDASALTAAAPSLAAIDDQTTGPLEAATRFAAPSAPADDGSAATRFDIVRNNARDTPRPATGGTAPVSSTENVLEAGQAFGPRYHIIRPLGVGGMGAVYQAWDAELGVAVAIKVIRPDVMSDPTAAAEIERRFKRELLLARQVTHKNVVRIHDLGDIDGIKYITMPYLDGADLSTVLKREGRLPIARVLSIARGVVAGLVEAHKAGVVHRDLKPANIMIGADDEAMIMDFGIARSTGSSASAAVSRPNTGIRQLHASTPAVDATVFGAVVGTVAYMAPEQATGVQVDQRADVYALGLILYDMLAGPTRTEGAENPMAELRARMEHAPPSVKALAPDVSDSVDQIISRCLDPDPAKRFQSSADLAAALGGLDERGKPIPVPARFGSRMMAGAVSVVLAVVGATWYVTRPVAPIKPHDPVTVLISDFANTTGEASFDHTLEPMLRLALEDAGFISAYDRTRIRAALGATPPETFDEAAARQVAMKYAVGVVLSGSIERSGSGYSISVKAAQPITDNVTANASLQASSRDQVLPTVTRLAATVRKALGEKRSESDQLFAMRSISSGSLDVMSEYAAGINLQSKGKYEEARQKFLKTVELDPKFGLGYQSLAVNSRNVGKLQDAEKYAKEALRYIDAMTERERFSTRGNYYRVTGDLQQCVKEYGEMIARYSADTVARNQRAICLVGLRDMKGAVEETQKALEILPNHMTYRGNLALFSDYAGDFETAEREVRAIQEPSARALQALPLSLLGQGKVSEAEEAYRRLTTMGPWGASFGAAGLGDLALYEGRYADAAQIFEQGVAADLAVKNSDAAALKLAALAHVHLVRGQSAAAIEAAEKALQNSQTLKVRFLSARVLVEAGAVGKAQAIAATLASELATEPQVYGKIVEGEIALKKRDLGGAVKILADANGVVDTWIGHFDLGRAYLEGRAFAQADSQFDRCIKRRGEALSFVDEDPTYGHFPPVYYYLGRAREGLQTAGFSDVYREYVNIRGKSTDDPLLHDVLRRIRN